jgi:hypothetical protein
VLLERDYVETSCADREVCATELLEQDYLETSWTRLRACRRLGSLSYERFGLLQAGGATDQTSDFDE